MISIRSLAAFLALVSLTVASPVQLKKRGHFSIKQIEGRRRIRQGPVAMRRGLQKWGAPVAKELEVAVASVKNGSVAAVPEEFDIEYLSPVTVGDRVLQLDFDTGSADL